MESITSVKIFHGSEFKANGKVIRWTEVQYTDTRAAHLTECLTGQNVRLKKKKREGAGLNVS